MDQHTPAVEPDTRPITAVWPGEPYPRGATWDGEGVNFALFAANAQKVELCLFDASGRHELQRIELRERTDEIWHSYLPEARPGTLYGYRVHGPYDPARGHRFNPHKLLIEPYAKHLQGPLHWSDAHFGYRVGHAREDQSFDRRDNAAGVPKCRVIDPAFTWGGDRPPRVPWHETVIYEAHVRGLTLLHPGIPQHLRGTYAGVATAPVIEHLKRLGITTLELMPVHAFVDDRYLLERGLRNYWGYNNIGFFAPELRYSSTGRISEFKTMVKTLHSAGIEVTLDVVYNHTAEGNHLGPTLCFRGIDNASYYRLVPEDPRFYMDFTGTGNTLNLQHPRVLHVERVAAAREIHVVARVVRHQPVVRRVVDAAERERRTHLIAFGRVVVDHIEDHFDAGRVQRLHHRLEFADASGRGVAHIRREEADGVVAPVVAHPALDEMPIVDEGVHGHQLDGRHAHA